MKTRRLIVALLVACTAAAAVPAVSAAAKFGTRTLKMGSKGKDVRVLQRGLTVLGYSTPADGVYGVTTKRNVKKLERKRRWKVDGKVNRKDAKRISRMVAKRRAKNQVSGLYYVGGLAKATVQVTAARAGDGRLDVVDDSSGIAVATYDLDFGRAGAASIPWNGGSGAGGFAPDATYRFKLVDPGTSGASISGGQKQPFLLRRHAFPVGGAHSYGGAGSRFGAPRSGHIHQGQDVSAACGTKLYATEAGTLATKAYQASGAGYYVVIHGAVTGTDHVYMHMAKPTWAVEGQWLYAGQQIGKVGTTGSSSGCHLHFERWTAPGWYQGGAAYDPLAELQYWDAYS